MVSVLRLAGVHNVERKVLAENGQIGLGAVNLIVWLLMRPVRVQALGGGRLTLGGTLRRNG